jgi:hypothetical protein
MAETNSLANRIDAEFSAVQDKIKKLQSLRLEEHKERQKRIERLGELFKELSEIWKPQLDLLVQKFGDRVQVQPRIVPSTREVTFEFQSRMARVSMKLSATTDREVQKLILTYDLNIVPVLMRYNPHSSIEFPLTAVDKKAAIQWIEDRIVEFVQTYLSMGENEVYFKDLMVEDPITNVSFPDFAAGATLEWQGKKYYFIGEETRREFEKQKGIAAK